MPPDQAECCLQRESPGRTYPFRRRGFDPYVPGAFRAFLGAFIPFRRELARKRWLIGADRESSSHGTATILTSTTS